MRIMSSVWHGLNHDCVDVDLKSVSKIRRRNIENWSQNIHNTVIWQCAADPNEPASRRQANIILVRKTRRWNLHDTYMHDDCVTAVYIHTVIDHPLPPVRNVSRRRRENGWRRHKRWNDSAIPRMAAAPLTRRTLGSGSACLLRNNFTVITRASRKYQLWQCLVLLFNAGQ